MLRSEMMERMPASEFFEWMVMEQIDPFGGKRGDIQAGIIAQTMANIHRDSKSQPYELRQFMPQFDPEPISPQTPEQMLGAMRILQAAQNSVLETGGR